jgi:hypothetical protein
MHTKLVEFFCDRQFIFHTETDTFALCAVTQSCVEKIKTIRHGQGLSVGRRRRSAKGFGHRSIGKPLIAERYAAAPLRLIASQ